MHKATIRKWSRDALEIIHQLKYESDDKSILIKRYAHRIVVLTDEARMFEAIGAKPRANKD